MPLKRKTEKLKKIIRSMGSCLVAFSGGVDSTFLLKISKDCLGSKVLAVTADSFTYPGEELGSAKRIASGLRARHVIIKTFELARKDFFTNPVNRCYYCKKELFSRLKEIAKKEKINFVVDASNASDKDDFRPGNLAKNELKIRSPLIEAGFTKDDIRSASRKLNLVTWDKPSLACLASRIPYGQRISRQALSRINQAEGAIKRMGFRQVRVRHYDRLCRIEIDKKELARVIKNRARIVEKLKKLGYNYVALDLEGYRSGSMNEGYLK
ncbi:MAG: ATP-dependent sacrificial sulfur transferase LarE [Candidatus Omnitrophica bacterium]|nr:ATP-dependent sacrificial sulfur transferase LarE [Candidatus Omnitrophota bacterium]